jgi:membrane protein DedA with SNARE-associated domain
VESAIVDWLASNSGYRIHVVVFILLVLGGFGFPIPEDIPILIGGALAAQEIVYLQAIFVTCYTGVLLADQVVYFAGYWFGPRLLNAGTKSKFLPSLTEEKVNRVREGIRKRRLVYIFLGRHLFPLRSVTFLCAGALRVPFIEFFIADAIAALVSVSVVLALGYWLGTTLSPEVISHIAHQAHEYIILIVAIVVLIFLVRRMLYSRSEEEVGAPEVESELEEPARLQVNGNKANHP